MDRNNNKLNAFENYGQFLDTGTDPGMKGKKKIDHFNSNDEFLNDMCSATDIDAILTKKFIKIQYPSDLTTINIFCPLCGKIITNKQLFSIYDSHTYNRKFLAHDICLSQQHSRLLNDFFDHVQQMSLTNLSNQPKIKILPIAIGDRQFCIQLSISHPLSDYKFLKLITKTQLNGNTLRWELKKQQQSFCYLPNIICFPFIDFKITLNISQIGVQQGKRIITNYINLSKTKLINSKQLIAKSQNLLIQLNILCTQKQKNQIISNMNYKYQYPQQLNIPIIQLIVIQIQIPQQQYDQQLYQNTNSTIVQLLSQKIQQSSFTSSVHLYSTTNTNNNINNTHINNTHINNINSINNINTNNNINKNYNYYQSPRIQNNNIPYTQIQQINQLKLQKSNSSAQKQRVDLQKLISSNKLSGYVRNGTQSRIFQSFLDQATNQQVQLIIKTLNDQIPDLVTDQYANYMTQKLFQVCSPNQRIFILTKLYPLISGLVRNKQGTHTIQAFISLLTLNQQYDMICSSISQQFQQLCFHSISTHFIQKIIKTFPLQHTIKFYQIANANFLKFATDKNAMCVLKYMLRRLKQYQDHININIITTEIKKHFINSITLNTDKIIQDCYGNYVVQFCYQLFGQAKSSGVTEMIIQKFVQFSLQKYSSSVVSKCVNTYWNDHSYTVRLKDVLKSQGILEMYRNREGNKILLDLMDKNQLSPLRDKIYNLLANTGEQSKFYHDRWGMQIGIRSGPVGIQFKNFTQADNQQKQQQQNNNNNNNNKKSKKK